MSPSLVFSPNPASQFAHIEYRFPLFFLGVLRELGGENLFPLYSSTGKSVKIRLIRVLFLKPETICSPSLGALPDVVSKTKTFNKCRMRPGTFGRASLKRCEAVSPPASPTSATKAAEGHLKLGMTGGVELESNPARLPVNRVFVKRKVLDLASPVKV
jgi:hypothetical protein